MRLVDDLKGWRTGSNGRGSLLKKEELLKELGKKHCQMNDVFKKQDFRGAEEFSSWFAYFHSSEDVSLYRNAEALAGRKVKQFFELLNSFIERESNLEFRNYLLPYHEYLAIRDEDYKPQNEQVQPFKDFHPRILKALCTETDKYVKSSIKSNNKGASLRKIETYVVGRMSMAGSYAFQEPDSEDKSNVLSFTEALRIEDEGKSGKYEYAHAEHNRKQFLQPLLGRYDALSYAKTQMLSRGPQPFFPYDSQAAPPRIEDECVKERFPTFFLRQEMATRVSLRQMQTPADSQYPQPFIACIAVTLQRRAYRLDFLYRLLRCGAEDDKERLRSSLKEAGIRFEPQDYAFLTDGWGDILLELFLSITL